MTPTERLSELHDQLEGIGGSNAIGMGKNKVKSMPDAIAKSIHEITVRQVERRDHLIAIINPNAATHTEAHNDVQIVTPTHVVKNDRRVRMDLCPTCGENALVSEEGCQHCNNCGYSRCG
jgi:ribonucleoside-diphosphate reductase alpha chain